MPALSLSAQPTSVEGTAFADNPLARPRLPEPLVLDGVPDESAWDAGAPLQMVAAVPVFGSEPSETTEVHIGHDDEYLWVAGRFADSSPEGMRVGSLTRDRPGDDDAFEIVLDTYGDNENAVGFSTNPAGIRIDFSVSNDGEPIVANRPSDDPAWDTFWDVETAVTEHGWTMEMRIPLSSLRFQDSEGQVTMGIIARRTIARKNEEITYPEIPPEWSGSYRKPSLGAKVTLTDVTSTRPVYVSPYMISGLQQYEESRTTDGLFSYRDLNVDTGLDVKYGLAETFPSIPTSLSQRPMRSRSIGGGSVCSFPNNVSSFSRGPGYSTSPEWETFVCSTAGRSACREMECRFGFS
jgi:hypothetical protein